MSEAVTLNYKQMQQWREFSSKPWQWHAKEVLNDRKHKYVGHIHDGILFSGKKNETLSF